MNLQVFHRITPVKSTDPLIIPRIEKIRKPGSLALNWLGERLQRKLGLWFANATTLIINEIDSQQQRARDLASLIPVSASN